jgi:hypothetical protein
MVPSLLLFSLPYGSAGEKARFTLLSWRLPGCWRRADDDVGIFTGLGRRILPGFTFGFGQRLLSLLFFGFFLGDVPFNFLGRGAQVLQGPGY